MNQRVLEVFQTGNRSRTGNYAKKGTIDGYEFSVKRSYQSSGGMVIYWECSNRICHVKIATEMDQNGEALILKENGEHCHGPNATKLEASRARASIRLEAKVVAF